MTDSVSSHRRILRSSSIIGGSAAVNIAVGLVKTKFAALWLGPSGLGMIVLLQSVMTTVATVAAVSINSSGTRAVAEAITSDDPAKLTLVRRALVMASIALAILGAGSFWLLSDYIPRWINAAPGDPLPLGWLAMGILITIAAQPQSALLIGYQRIGNLARASIIAVMAGSVVQIIALRAWGISGITLFVLAPPIVSFLTSQYYVRALPAMPKVRTPLFEIAGQVKTLLGFGLALTVGTATTSIVQLAARGMIQHNLGAASVGWFQAAWLISMTYIGFVLQAMGADFYPRITAARNDLPTVNRLVNEQTEVALLLGAPVMLATLGGASWILRLLYSSSFHPALPVLQWQIIADIFKIASWPLGFALLGLGRSRTYMLCEISGSLVLLGVLTVALPRFGLEAAGIAVLAMYAVYLPLVFFIVHRQTQLRWSPQLVGLFTAIAVAACALVILSNFSLMAGGLAGVLLAGAFGLFALYRLRDAMPDLLRRAAHKAAQLLGRK